MTTAAQKSKSNPYGNVFSEDALESHVDEYKKKQEAYKESAASGGGKKKFPVYFDLDEGEEANARFLEFDPVKFWQHRVFDPESKKGSGGYRVFSCTREPSCPLCMAGDKPAFKVAWQIVHLDALDPKTGEVTPRVKLLVKGIRFAEYYAKKTAKNDPTKQNVTLERIGSGQNTQYLFAGWGDKGKIEYDSSEEVELEDYFGIDDEKFADMERIASSLGGKSGSGEKEYSGPKKGKRYRAEEGDDVDGDIPF